MKNSLSKHGRRIVFFPSSSAVFTEAIFQTRLAYYVFLLRSSVFLLDHLTGCGAIARCHAANRVANRRTPRMAPPGSEVSIPGVPTGLFSTKGGCVKSRPRNRSWPRLPYLSAAVSVMPGRGRGGAGRSETLREFISKQGHKWKS